MAHPRKSLKTLRKIAFEAQRGKCYYCCQPMWTGDHEQISFVRRYNLSKAQGRLLKCTGEHLLPHKHGGMADTKNIVAACQFCNARRHRRTAETSVSEFMALVRRRMIMGRWHGLDLSLASRAR